MNLDTEITCIQGIGQKRADLLKKEIGVATLADLLSYYPYKYVDRSRFYRVNEIDETMPYIQLKGRILSAEYMGEGRARRYVAHFTDGTGFVDLVWFQGIRYVEGKYRLNTEYVIFGKPNRFGSRLNIAHPEIEPFTENYVQQSQGFQPLYNTTEKMKSNFLNSNALRKVIKTALMFMGNIPETLPANLIQRYSLCARGTALQQIHFPQNNDLLNKARYRLKFEELFYVQLSILRQTKYREQRYRGFVFGRVGALFNDFYAHCLPFSLTNAQKRVLHEIRADMNSGRQMNRLLQGDVGSGKTIVALMSALIALDNHFQACVMAPTEILANQHFETINAWVQPLGIHVALLTGSTKKTARLQLHEQLRNGTLQLLIGTHALLEDEVEFHNLGLVVIDEQHRFGVAQRAKLWTKNVQPPHILVMTATPIPRTLAMTLYGDLDVSILDELPPGRKPIQTFHYFDNKREALNGFLWKQIEKGRQIYIVYPLIQESEKMDLKNLEDGYAYICERFPSCRISMVHGKMKASEKDAEMQRFLAGETQIMVATTVIEVGVNVPNASVMVIENAERFGLSQLHQLRGRVGRGAEQSYCILMSKFELSKETRQRLDTMVRTNDGFEIAEADLQLRGPGDIDGTLQSGLPFDLKIANLARDGQVLQIAREAALDILKDDPLLQNNSNALLLKQLEKMQRHNLNWSSIS